MFVLDSHCDTPSQIYRLRDVGVRNDHGHVDYIRMKEGGVDGAFFALYVRPTMSPQESTDYARQLLDGVLQSLKDNPDKAVLTLSPQEAFNAQARGLISIFISIENGSAIQTSLPLLRDFYGRGVRCMTLAHTRNNEICDSCSPKEKRWGGLSPFGREVVAEMNRLGMIIDVSHISDDAFYDVLQHSAAPVVATHSCCRALSPHPRNLTDQMIKDLAAADGVIQINFYPTFLDASFADVLKETGLGDKADAIEWEFIQDPADPAKRAAWYAAQDELLTLPRPSCKLIADHVDHVVSLVGPDHVGLGSDFDGIEVTPEGLDDVSRFHLILDELKSRGYSDQDLEKIAGGNFLRVFQKVIDCSTSTL